MVPIETARREGTNQMEVVKLLLVVLAAVILIWGFDRYRERFIKTDLLISLGIAAGILTFVFVPTVYDLIGAVLDLQRRVVTISVLSNIVLLIGLLYVLSVTRKNRGQVTNLNRNLSVELCPELEADGGSETIAVVIPAYNEETTIGTVIDSLPETIRGYAIEPVVVSDGSVDRTAAAANAKGATVVEHPVNQGQGGALKTGFDVAAASGATIVVTMDADGQHPATELERFVTPIIENEADYVMGSRHVGKDFSQNSWLRRVGIRFFTWLINTLTKASITDCTNGYRAIRGSELEGLTLTEERFSAPELIVEARKNDLRIKEIPITIAERQAGETTKPQLMYAIGLARTILVTWIR